MAALLRRSTRSSNDSPLCSKRKICLLYRRLRSEARGNWSAAALWGLYALDSANQGVIQKPGGKVLDVIKQWFGSYEQWEDEFNKTANVLGCA